VDEGGRYANMNLADLLNYKGKTGLQLIFAHHHLTQIRDIEIRDTVLNQTSTKIVFRTENPSDSLMLAKMMYGGEVRDRDASYFFKNLKRQECVIKIPGQDAMRVRVPDVEPPPDDVDIEAYLEYIYSQGCYLDVKEIHREIRSRFNNNRSNTSDTIYYEKKPASPRPSRKRAKPNKQADNHSAEPGTQSIFDQYKNAT
jgi:hypothetical protein